MIVALTALLIMALPGTTITLPANPFPCERYIIRHPDDNSTIVVTGKHRILGYEEVIMVMAKQTLDVEFRDDEWQDPIEKCAQ